MNIKSALFLLSLIGSLSVFTDIGLSSEDTQLTVWDSAYFNSLKADFSYRDTLPETEIPREQWKMCCGTWGPWALLYPRLNLPPYLRLSSPARSRLSQWLRDRVVAVAQKFIGLPYQHKHIPQAGGLDCSNFTAWIYNYGFGIYLDSNILRQSETAGRKLQPYEPIKPGDLLFFWNQEKSQIVHVAIYVNENTVIDSTGPGVQVRSASGRYKTNFAWARRVID